MFNCYCDFKIISLKILLFLLFADNSLEINWKLEVLQKMDALKDVNLDGVKNIILVLSGKGNAFFNSQSVFFKPCSVTNLEWN